MADAAKEIRVEFVEEIDLSRVIIAAIPGVNGLGIFDLNNVNGEDYGQEKKNYE